MLIVSIERLVTFYNFFANFARVTEISFKAKSTVFSPNLLLACSLMALIASCNTSLEIHPSFYAGFPYYYQGLTVIPLLTALLLMLKNLLIVQDRLLLNSDCFYNPE